MDGGKDIELMFDKKKKKGKDSLLQKFHGQKENKEFSVKKDQAVLLVQKF